MCAVVYYSTAMNLRCPSFSDGGLIPATYTCQGDDVRPPLFIVDPPESVKSFAIIVSDPNASSGDFVHWLIWDISPSVRDIEERMTPLGAIEGTSDFGEVGWGGPCPPSGTHRYEFRLYALDAVIGLSPTSTKREVRAALEGHIIGESLLVGFYRKG